VKGNTGAVVLKNGDGSGQNKTTIVRCAPWEMEDRHQGEKESERMKKMITGSSLTQDRCQELTLKLLRRKNRDRKVSERKKIKETICAIGEVGC